MPTYQYACTECDHAFEQFQAFNEDTLTECPVCQGRLRKVFNAVGVVFKGSGFYRTDSRAASKATGSSDTTTGSSGSDKPANAGSESSKAPAPKAGAEKAKTADSGSSTSPKPA